MKRDYRDYIIDIITSIEHISLFIEGQNFEEFFQDIKTSNAVIRSLEVIGEASKKMPEEIRKHYPDIPWKKMSGMRDKLIHEYFGIDLKIVWAVCKEELPPLLPEVKTVLKKMQQDYPDSS